ncbi:hypothetical protein BDV25DRAFT_142915 [Aspergillus avenaceus]|uniref:C2H2-type domain-containing protein n=1 Tax=Aspergillus avenaceus TaxID=36643 RepID=A0A5N6TLQ8_ASPAV|nr:hypothetical protein BDV25DRAFT_142915 [Aspergillus avenaceus]
MERAPRPFPSPPSTAVRSPPDDPMVLENTSAYPAPIHSVPIYQSNSQSAAGLGISHCEMEGYPSPAADWSNHLMPPDHLLEATIDVESFSPETHYEPYCGRSDVSVSPFDYYSPQIINTSSGYSTGGATGTLSAPSQFWPHTPHSDATSIDIPSDMKEEPDESWDPPVLADLNDPSILSHMPHLVADGAYYNTQQIPEIETGTLIELNPSVDCFGDCGQDDAAPNMPIEVILDWAKPEGEVADKRCKVPPASGLQCTICGAWFTRRSNCREHMKRHDPSQRKSYPCEFCDRPFGRRTDLRRHVDSIHHGIRKFGCEQCGQRFSRHDTLSRHQADGCHRRPRNRDTPREKEATQAAQYSSPSPDDTPDRNKRRSAPKH